MSKSVTALSHDMDRFADDLWPARDADAVRRVSQALTDDGRVRAERLDGFVDPARLPGVGLEFVGEAVATLDFPSIAAHTCSELTITVEGAQANDRVILGPPSAMTVNLSWGGYVDDVDTVAIRLCNPTTGAINPGSRVWSVTVIR